MRAGRLRYRVLFQRLAAGSPQQKATGEPDVDWADVVTLYADVRPLKAAEQFAAEQVASRVDYEIEVRHSSGDRNALAAGMRAVWDGKYFDIAGVLSSPLKDSMVLQCASGMNVG